MSHLPPLGDTIPDLLATYQQDLAVGLYTNPVAPETVTQLSDLIGNENYPEPNAATLPGYARQFPSWQTLAAESTFASIAGTPAFVAGGNPPSDVELQGWFLVAANSGTPALVTFGQFPAMVPVSAAGDGVVIPMTVTASQAGVGSAASVSNTSAPVRVSRAQLGRHGFEFKGQDRRMVEQLLKALLQTQAHDGRVGNLSRNTRRSSISILDPDDPAFDLSAAAQALVERCYILLAL